MKRHAYLIMAHNQPELLNILLHKLDVPENDIYVHIDSKSNLSVNDFSNIVTEGCLYFTKRISVNWGGYSQIEATLILLKAAIKKKHVYYHMLSGVDLPIKPIQEINAFYNQYNKEFIRFFSKEKASKEYYRRFVYKNVFRDKFGRKRCMWKYLNRLFYELQRIFRIKDERLNNKFFLGYSSWDITHDLATYILQKEDYIQETYRYTSCCDEVFLNSLIYETKFWNKLYIPYSENGTGMEANMRFIDFSDEINGSPHIIENKDVKMLMKSKLNFARKFDISKIDAIKLLNEELERGSL